MGRFLKIADEVLGDSDDTTETVANVLPRAEELRSASPTQCERSELSEISPQEPYREFEPSDSELQNILGDEWSDIKSDPAQLETCRSLVTEARMLERGLVPRCYTAVTHCKHCGPVFIYEGYPNPANNCPWCFRRLKGLPIPKGE